jgi:hypothetical protein
MSFFFIDQITSLLILKSRSSSDFHTSNYEAPKSVPPSYLRSQFDYSCSKLKTYGGRKHLENLADNMGTEHFPSTVPYTYLHYFGSQICL